VVVVDTRFAVVDRSSVVSLSGPVQAQSATANLVNAARADVANGINVLSGRNPQLTGTQTNTVSQAESRIGYLGSSSLLGKNIQTAFSHTASNSSFSRSSISFQHIDTTSTHTETSSTFMANVPKYNPLADLTLPLGSFSLGNKDLGMFTLGGFVAGVGVQASVGEVVALGPGIDLGTIHFTGKDIVINTGSVTLPGIDFGSASITACGGELGCSTSSSHIGVLGGSVIDSPFGTLRFTGANPFGALDLSLNSGFAAAGTGELHLSGGAVTVSTNVRLSLPALTNLGKVTADIGHSLGGLELGIPDFSIPDLVLSVKLDSNATTSSINTTQSASAIGLVATLPLGGGLNSFNVDLKFDGAFCMDVSSHCEASGSISSEKTSAQVNSFVVAGQAESGSSATSADSGSRRVVLGGSVEGASGRYIVVSDAAFAGTDGSEIALSNGAQSNMKALNAVNASGTIVGNGLNLAATAQNSTAGGTRFAQENFVVQRR
jgi:hypothetical protein